MPKVETKVETGKITVAMTVDMIDALNEERKIRKIASIPEVVRIIVSEYFREKTKRE